MTEKPIAHHFGYKYHSPFGHDADVLRYDAGPWNGQHPHAVVAFYTEAQLDAYTAELRAECERLRSAALLAAETFERYEALPRAAADEIEALRAENERLRMELEHEEQRVADMMDAVNRVGHEIERLRAELEPAEAAFEVVEDDADAETQCAYITGPREQALREAMHYAAVYSKDGPVKVREVIRRDIPMEASND